MIVVSSSFHHDLSSQEKIVAFSVTRLTLSYGANAKISDGKIQKYEYILGRIVQHKACLVKTKINK